LVSAKATAGLNRAGSAPRATDARAAMSAAVLGARHALRARGVVSPWLLLVVEIVVGALVYVPMALLVARETSLDFVRRVKQALGRD